MLMQNRKHWQDSYVKIAVPRNAYEAWYMSLGGCTYKGKLPRGKKFSKAISSIKNNAFRQVSTSRPLITRSRKDKIFIDEINIYPV